MATVVVGQIAAREAALAAVARAENPLRDRSRPVAVIYELGPSRTGKTLIAEQVAEMVGGKLLKINGGSYKQAHQVAQLIGSPPGYYGWRKPADDEDGTKRPKPAGRNKNAKLDQTNIDAHRGTKVPVTVILIDEANLMHSDFDDPLMSITDKGELDMGNNEVADFKNCIIFLTSNLGMAEVMRKSRRGMGFNARPEAAPSHDEIEKTIKEALQERYRPEWLNRVDAFVIFEQHDTAGLYSIVDTELNQVRARMAKDLPRGLMFTLDVEDSAKKFLLASTLADKGNLAELKRSLQKFLIDPLGNVLKQALVGNGDVVVVQHVEGAKELSFFLAEGEKHVDDCDDIEVAHETPDTQAGLATQRNIAAAKRVKTVPYVFDITLREVGERRMISQGTELMRELREIYGITVQRHSWAHVRPWVCIIQVSATDAQIEEFRKVNSEVTVVRKGATSAV
jgi:hypothetical protein